jgi:hypothetical protein
MNSGLEGEYVKNRGRKRTDSGAVWFTPVIPVFRRQRQENCKRLEYIVSSKPA